LIVIDASAAIELLFGRPLGEAADGLVLHAPKFAAPQLLPIEILNVLRKGLLSKTISNEVAQLAIKDLLRLNIEYYDTLPFADDIWNLRDNFTAYDAAYIALAMKLDVPLLTRDARMASHAKTLVHVI
jgi:predicted nucleic acid-binding protein